MAGDDVMASKIEKFNDTDFGYWRMQIEEYLYGKKLHLLLLGKQPEKIDSLPGNHTWELTELSPGKKTLDNKCVYRVKAVFDGSKKYNGTLVVKGFQQRHDIANAVGVVSRNMSNPGRSLEIQGYVNVDMPTKGYS